MLFSKIIEKKFAAVLGRYDGNPAMRYHVPGDFPGLKWEAFDIPGDVLLKGCFYYYGEFRPENLIVFDHGISAGHLAYLPEIEYLAKNGYLVYSYDHTGCVATGGEGIRGFAQGVADLDRVLTVLNKDPRFAQVPRKIMGHSWGAYACMNAAALHPEVSHVVSLAGFLSARSLSEQYIPKPFLKYSEEVMARERIHNPKYADMDARDSLKKSQAKFLHLQSHDDKMVKFDLACVPLQEALEGRPDTEFLVLDRKNHDPQRTEAAALANNLLEEDLKMQKKKLRDPQAQKAFQEAHDWAQLEEQDDQVWAKILDFLRN